MKLHLSETSAWTGALYELRIESSLLSFTGHDHFQDRFPKETTLKEDTILSIRAALELLEVTNWKPEYELEDIGVTIDDGGSWEFEYSIEDIHFKSKGTNAYPSFSSFSVTTCEEERFALLREAIFSSLARNIPFTFSFKRGLTRRCS